MSKKFDYYGNEIPKEKKRYPAWVNTTIYATLGVSLGVGVVFGVMEIIKAAKGPDYGFVDQNVGPAITYRFDSTDPGTKLNGNFEFEVVEYKTQYLVDDESGLTFKDNDYFLGQQGIQMLVNRMASDMIFGPEIMNLKRIYINNQNMTTPGENGIYFPASDEIGINTNNFATRMWSPHPSEDFINRNDTLQYRVEMVFQTLVHEYGHHIAHSYMTSSINNYTNDIYTDYTSGRKRDNWNKHFIEVFKSALDYDKDTPLVSGSSTSDGYESVGSIYDAEDLYRLANSKQEPQYIGKNDFVFADVDAFNGGQSIFERLNPIETDNLEYLYAIQELSTRKYLQIFYRETPYSINLRDAGIPSANLENQIYYETPFRDNKRVPSRYMEDNIFNEKPDPVTGIVEHPDVLLYNELKKQFGIDKNLSFIWGKNDAFVNNDMTLTNDNPRDNSNNNLIRLGGYVNDGTISSIGYLDDQGNFIKIDDVKPFVYSFNKKANLNDMVWVGKNNPRLDDSIQNRFAWVSDHYIDVSQYANKELVFKNKSNAIIPLTSARSSDATGYASNYMSHLPSLVDQYHAGVEEQNIKGTFYVATAENGKVKLVPVEKKAEVSK